MHLREYFEDKYGKKCSLQQRTPFKDNLSGEILIEITGQRGGQIELNKELVKQLLPGMIYFAEYGELPPNINVKKSDDLFSYEDYEK